MGLECLDGSNFKNKNFCSFKYFIPYPRIVIHDSNYIISKKPVIYNNEKKTIMCIQFLEIK